MIEFLPQAKFEDGGTLVYHSKRSTSRVWLLSGIFYIP